jgi:hypothetical protein
MSERDPANELYDSACELLAAAQDLRAAAGPRRAAPAIAASLGCVEASLEALATAITVMRVAALEQGHVRRAGGAAEREALEIRARFEQLARDLSMSRSSCARARELAGPLSTARRDIR